MEHDISQIVMTIVVVCLFLWRISYGKDNGLFAEAAGLIAVLAAFAAVYYITNIAGSVLTQNYGQIIPKFGYLVVAFLIYRIMTAIGSAFKKLKEVPVVGTFDRICGAVLGFFEAAAIIYLVEYITDIEIIAPVLTVWSRLYSYIKELIYKYSIKD